MARSGPPLASVSVLSDRSPARSAMYATPVEDDLGLTTLLDDRAVVNVGDSHPEVKATTRLPRDVSPLKDAPVVERGLVPEQQPSAEPLALSLPTAPPVCSGQLPRIPVTGCHTLEPGWVPVS